MAKKRIDYYERYSPFEKGGIVYGRITDFDLVSERKFDKDEVHITLSLTNDKLINHNSIFFSNGGFVSALIAYINDRSPSNRSMLEKVYYAENTMHEINDFIGNDQENSYSFLDEPRRAAEQIRTNLRPYLFMLETSISRQSIIKRFSEFFESQVYFQMEILSLYEEEYEGETEEDDEIIYGMLSFSASTPQQVYAKLKIRYTEKKKDSEIGLTIDKMISLTRDNTINTSNLNEYQHKINDVLPRKIKQIDFTCFNVGSGLNTNINIISKNRKVTRLKFDIGVTRTSSDVSFQHDKAETYDNPEAEIFKIPDVIILSHWDIDHIKAIEYYDSYDIYTKHWLAPDINEINIYISDYAKMLCACIYINERIDKKGAYLHLVEAHMGNIYTNDYMTISRTKGINVGTSSECKNNNSLILELHHSRSLLITGDSDYDNLPDYINDKNYDVLIVPHHGSANQNLNIYPCFPFRFRSLECDMHCYGISAACLFGSKCCIGHWESKEGSCIICMSKNTRRKKGTSDELVLEHLIYHREMARYVPGEGCHTGPFSVAVIPVGANTYKHPQLDEINKIQNQGFITWCTCCCGSFNISL